MRNYVSVGMRKGEINSDNERRNKAEENRKTERTNEIKSRR
jgi:hypothetical protein